MIDTNNITADGSAPIVYSEIHFCVVAQGNYYLVVDARTREVVNGWGKDECNALACAVGSCRLHATAVQVAEELDELEDDMRRARKRIQRRIDSLKRIGENMLATQGTQGA